MKWGAGVLFFSTFFYKSKTSIFFYFNRIRGKEGEFLNVQVCYFISKILEVSFIHEIYNRVSVTGQGTFCTHHI